jgi:tetratricopeptide (TPR) repeat protein
MNHCAPLFGALTMAALAVASPLAAQQPNGSAPELKREVPGTGPYVCPAPAALVPPNPGERRRAAQLASDAQQAGTLGDFEGEAVLLAQASELDPTSAEYAFRRANALESLERTQEAIDEYCRAIDLGFDPAGAELARERIDEMYEQIRVRLPARAQRSFVAGLEAADDTLWVEAIDSFSVALDVVPTWSEPLYNRAVIHDYLGRLGPALADYRRYLDVVDDPTDEDGIFVAQRIGALEGMAAVSLPNPTQALALGALPGMGQFYTQRPRRGAAALATATFFIAAGALIREVTVLCVEQVPEGEPCPPGLVVEEVTERPYLGVGIGLAAVVTIGAAVEAYLFAKKAREENLAILGTEETEGGLDVGMPTVSARGSQFDFTFVRYRFR